MWVRGFAAGDVLTWVRNLRNGGLTRGRKRLDPPPQALRRWRYPVLAVTDHGRPRYRGRSEAVSRPAGGLLGRTPSLGAGW
jgi:hypothetical protein